MMKLTWSMATGIAAMVVYALATFPTIHGIMCWVVGSGLVVLTKIIAGSGK